MLPHLNLEVPYMVKIDVQGFEDKVLLGGELTIRHASMLIIETSFQVLYEGQALFGDVDFAKGLGTAISAAPWSRCMHR
ncbi:MAG: FkbM family methyltransferase [Caldilineaceae bacterium]